MEQSPSSEANSHFANQETPCLLWKPKVHYYVHKSPPSQRPCVTFCNKLVFYSEGLSAPHPAHKLEDYPSVAICNSYPNMWRPHPPYATRKHIMPL